LAQWGLLRIPVVLTAIDPLRPVSVGNCSSMRTRRPETDGNRPQTAPWTIRGGRTVGPSGC
jgi:hypothetical protein